MSTIIYGNMIPFLSLLALLFLIRHNHLFDRRQGNLFYLAIGINLTLLIAISLDHLLYNELSELPYAWIYRRITSCLNFAASPVIPLLLYRIFMGKKLSFLFYIPCILNILICFSSMFWVIVFEVSDQNTYSRGTLFFVPFLTSILYLVFLIARMGRFGRKGKNSERIFLLCVIASLFFGMYLEIVWRYKFLSWAMAAISLVLYYLLININISNSDPLTGAFNRAMYMKRLSEIDGSSSRTIALIDINDFKLINDLQGHDAGDKCLIHFVSIVQDEMEKGSTFYRIGGDEFAILSKRWSEMEMRKHLEYIRMKANLAHINFAYGIVEYKPDLVLDDVLLYKLN